MKKTTAIALTGALMAGSMSVLAASAPAPTIGVVDMDQIVSQSPQAKQIKTDLEKQFAPDKKKITSLSNDFQDDVKNYQKNKSTMSKKDLAALEKKMQDEQTQLQTLQTKVQQDLQAAQNKKMEEFLDSVKDAAKTVSSQNKLEAIFPANAVVFSVDGTDVTDQVLKVMSKNS